mmetsp:Transcript_58755/g.137153  ORF Transcript_58755/g.137153 Transcript_58755/m.137153 type:complete len:546 (+) Transcript_58755:89-1726(+)
MKFAKTLHEQALQFCFDQCLNYKLMKKVLKSDDMEEVAREFTKLFQAELRKVQTFMIGQQQDVHNSLPPLEIDIAPLMTSDHGLSIEEDDIGPAEDHCKAIVDKISMFRHYANLNGEAIRKIIKKFDKRLNMSFHDHFVLDTPLNNLVTARDIGVWLLDPAMHCLRLMRVVLGAQRVHRPLMQFNFWLEELKAGAKLARSRSVSGEEPDPTSMRLAICGNQEDMALCVKNTFIDCQTGSHQSHRRRARSLPPTAAAEAGRLVLTASTREASSSSSSPPRDPSDETQRRRNETGVEVVTGVPLDVPVVCVEHFVCRSLQIAPPHRVYALSDEEDELDESLLLARRGNPPLTMLRFPGAPVPNCSQIGLPIEQYGQSCSSSSQPSGVRQPSSYDPGQAYGVGGMRSARWWTEVPDNCPLTGFPIRLLPYPPFKLTRKTGNDGRDENASLLVDGPSLVLKVLSTWRFEVLGEPLIMSDISNLDAYMKRCKLGPFRLGPALELFCKGTTEAHRELEALRAKARKRLDNVKHIQRGRLQGAKQGGRKSHT